jgi:4-hydroxy-tetrahydrodipicolinate synthase
MRCDRGASILARYSLPQVTSRRISSGFFPLQPHGSITALATPFAANGDVDFDAWNALLAHQIAAGTQAVVVAGSTGEAAQRVVAARVPVIAGTGLSNTAKTIAQCRVARDAGADAALVVTPPYVRPTQEGLRRHYLEVADNGGLPVLLYNVPGRTGCDLLPDTVAQLASHPNIVAIKEARPEAERMHALLALRSPTFAVLSGDDPTACRAVLAGADGVISVASNVVPAAFRRLIDLAREGRTDEAQALDAELQPIFAFLGIEPNPIPVKALLAELGRCRDMLRLPLLPLSQRATLHAMAAQVGVLESRSQACLAA